MKKLLLASAVLTIFSASIILFQMSSCTKAVAQETKTDTIYSCSNNIYGLWVGTFVGNGDPNSNPQYFNLIIKADGTVINETKANHDSNSDYLNIGTWSYSGTTFTGSIKNVWGTISTYVGDVQTITAIYSIVNGIPTLSGTYNDVTISGSGTFSLTKVN